MRAFYFILFAAVVAAFTLGGLLLVLREPGEPGSNLPRESEKVAPVEEFIKEPGEGWAGRVTVTPPAKLDAAKVIDEAVSRALAWLAMTQKKNGSWDDKINKYDVGVTALALLAFMESGSTPADGPYSGWVANGFNYLLRRQDGEGWFGHVDAESWIYNHAIALLAVARAYGYTKNGAYKRAAKRAAEYLLKAQNPGLGWKYKPQDGRNDTSVTSWVTLALKEAAKHGTVEVDQAVFMGTLNWLDRATNTAGKAGYMRPGDDGSVISDVNDDFAKYPSSTAAALVCRHLCGQSRRDRKVALGMNVVFSQPAEWFMGELNNIDFYFAFWASTAAKMLVPVEKRAEWTSRLASSILAMQEETGKNAGSFRPWGKWSMIGGRAYSTAMCTLALLNLQPEPGSDSFKLTITKHRLNRPDKVADLEPFDTPPEETETTSELDPEDVPVRAKGGPITLQELAHVLRSLSFTLTFQDNDLISAMSFLMDIAKVSIVVSGEIPDRDFFSFSLRLRDIPFPEVLEAICLSIGGLDYGLYMTEKGVPAVLVSTSDDIARLGLKKPDDYPALPDCSAIKAKLPGVSETFGLSPEEVKKTEAVEKKLKDKAPLDPRMSTLGELWQFIEKNSGLSVTIDEQIRKYMPDDTRIGSGTKERSYGFILKKVVDYFGYDYIISPDGIIFPTYGTYRSMRNSGTQRQNKRERQESLQKKVEDKFITLNYVSTSFEQCIESLRDKTGFTYVLTSAAHDKTDDSSITYKCHDMRLDRALSDICRKANLTWEFRGSFILIKTRGE